MSQRAPSAKPSRFVYVFTDEGGEQQKYKLVVKGDLRQLGTRKMKRYLEKATGIPESRQQIFFRGQPLQDEADGDAIGLFHGAELFLAVAPSTRTKSASFGRASGGRANSHDCNGSHPEEGMRSGRNTTARLSVPADSSATSRCLTFSDDAPLMPSPRDGPRQRQRSASPVNLTVPAVPAARQSRLTAESTHLPARNLESASFMTAGSHVHCNPAVHKMTSSAENEERDYSHTRYSSQFSSSLPCRTSPEIASRQRNSEGSSQGQQSQAESATAWIASQRSSSTLRRGERPSVPFPSQRPSLSSSCQARDPRLSLLEAENDAMQRENGLLRDKLLEVERRAVNGTANWQLQEQIEELQDALLEKEAETEEAVKEAEERARVKEEELVRELDALRDERRRLRRAQAAAEQEQRVTMDSLRAQLQAQKAEMNDRDEMLQQLRANLAEFQCRAGVLSPLSPLSTSQKQRGVSLTDGSAVKPNAAPSLDALVQASLDRLALVFNSGDMELDENNTCVLQVDTDDLTSDDTVSLLITLDCATERLYLYATVLNELPRDDCTRLRLYERLLEGSLLGKDMAGAGVGVSKDSGLVLMSISVDVRRSDPNALAACARPFVAAVREWMTESESIVSFSKTLDRS